MRSELERLQRIMDRDDVRDEDVTRELRRLNDRLDAGVPERPKSGDYDTLEGFRAAMEEWREAKAEAVGPATRRGRTPATVTRDPGEPRRS